MFRKPTKRSLQNPKPQRYFFTDLAPPTLVPRMNKTTDEDNPNMPSSVTSGGTAGPGMYQELIGQFPIEGDKYAYFPTATPNGYVIMQQELGTAGKQPKEVGSFPQAADWYYWFDTTTLFFRLWRTFRAKTDMGDVSPGTKQGRAVAKAVGDTARRINTINDANKTLWNKR